MTHDTILELHHVCKDFGGLRAVHDASLAVPRGGIVGLIGPNGSGKSTLLNVIDGALPPSAGNIRFDGQDITNLSADAIFQLGLARGYQDPSLFFQMTVLDNTLLPVKHQRGEHPWYAPWRRTWKQQEQDNSAKASKVLQQVNLHSHFAQLASDLSGGQMKLLEIARSLTGDPKLLLLDEPTAGVAPTLAYSIFEQIEQMRKEQGITFLIVEHRLEILFDFVDTVYVMHMGSIFTHGTPEDVALNSAVREIYFGD